MQLGMQHRCHRKAAGRDCSRVARHTRSGGGLPPCQMAGGSVNTMYPDASHHIRCCYVVGVMGLPRCSYLLHSGMPCVCQQCRAPACLLGPRQARLPAGRLCFPPAGQVYHHHVGSYECLWIVWGCSDCVACP